MPGKFLALGLVHWGQPGFPVAASLGARLGTGPEGLPGRVPGAVQLEAAGLWVMGSPVAGLQQLWYSQKFHWSVYACAQGMHPPVRTPRDGVLATRRRQDDSSHVVALC